jgi:hypothetical protein
MLAPLDCPDAPGKRLRPAQVQAAINAARQAMKKRGLHALDLEDAEREQLSALERAELPCERWRAARALSNALREITVDQAFTRAKWKRVMSLGRDAALPAPVRQQVDTLVREAGAQLLAGRLGRANGSLNQALELLVDAHPPATPQALDIDDAEVRSACPTLSAQSSLGEVDALWRRLAGLLDERRLRPLDARQGPELLAEATEAEHLEAARRLCVLLGRLSAVEIDMGFVTRRFHALRQRALPDTDAELELLRTTSDALAEGRYAAAHDGLEQLLVLAGEPERPSSGLRR